MLLEWEFRVRWNRQLSLCVNFHIPVSCQDDTPATREGFPMNRCHLQYYVGYLSQQIIAWHFCPMARVWKCVMVRAHHTSRWAQKKREHKHMEPAAHVWKPGGSTEADVSSASVREESPESDAPVISHLEVIYQILFKCVVEFNLFK